MRFLIFSSAILSAFLLTGCGTDANGFVECRAYPLKETRKLIKSMEFEYLKFHKAATFDALRSDGQFLMADSKFDFSTSYVLYMNYQTGSQNMKQHNEGCIASSSLSMKIPQNVEQNKIFRKYQDFLISNGIKSSEIADMQHALMRSSEYTHHANIGDGYRLFYGLSDHPVRGKFFKIDVKK